MGINQNETKFLKIHDLINLFYIHKKICSINLNIRRYQDGLKLINRIKKNIHIYDHCYDYHHFFRIVEICVDYLHTK